MDLEPLDRVDTEFGATSSLRLALLWGSAAIGAARRTDMPKSLRLEQLEERCVLSANALSETVVQCCSTPAASVLHAVDIDGDGDNDLIANTFLPSKRVVLFENAGGGEFGAPVPLASTPHGVHVNSIDSGDIDGDGDADVIVGGDNNKVQSFINEGDGVFVVRTILTGEANDSVVRVADVDNDGDLDIVSAHRSGGDELLFHENLGNGQFDTFVISTDSIVTRDLEFVDADRDGDLDIAVASWKQSEFAIYENLSGGDFSSKSIFAKRPSPMTLTVADFNGDNYEDIATLSSEGPGLLALHESSAGALNFSPQKNIDAGDFGIASPQSADIDADGDVDIVAAIKETTANGNHVYRLVWYANEDVGFGSPRIIDPDVVYPRFESILATDLDGDGDTDVALATGDTVVWYDNVGVQGGFSESKYISQSPFFTPASAADFDGDGDLDLLSGDRRRHTRALVWRENDGSGAFTTEHEVIDETSFDTLSADVDDDGDLDIVDVAMVFEESRLSIRGILNDGNGKFDRPLELASVPYDVNHKFDSFTALDYSGDGVVDILFQLENSVVLLENGAGNSGSIQFHEPRTIVESAARLVDFAIADLNSDGISDVLASDYIEDRPEDTQDTEVKWYPRLADGSLSEARLMARINDSAGALLNATDVDGDGDIDVTAWVGGRSFFLTSANSRIAWFENNGSGDFQTPVLRDGPGANVGPAKWDTEDIDFDGDLDIVATIVSFQESKAVYLKFNSDKMEFGEFETFHNRTVRRADGSGMGYTIGDFDGNGLREIILGTYEGLSLFTPTATPKVGDVNLDGRVNFRDFQVLAENFGKVNASRAEGDFDGDSMVTFTDFILLAGNFAQASMP